LQPNTVLIHAVALDEVSIKKISDKKVSLVWCPASNLFMFKATSPVNILKNKLRVALGTDSTMTGSSTLLEEMKVAFETRMVTPKEIYEMVTFTASSIFSCAVPGIKSGREANFFIAPKIHENYYENLVQLNPQDIILVMSKGEIQLIDSFVGISNKTLRHTVSLNDRLKQTTIDIDELKKRIEKSVSLSILEKNQLWMMIH
jgi:cytosine/adenosine deaminase-related metal-dependent hydrolase